MTAPPLGFDYVLTAPESVQLAARWWDKTGRGMVNRKANEERAPDVRKGAGLNGAPAIVVKSSAERTVNSGILDGRKWDDLDAREKHAVVRAWVTIMRVKIRDPDERAQ